MQTRAWSTLTLKSVSEELRVIEGVASTPSTDRAGDRVEPLGAEFDLPIPLLFQHDAAQPIGHVTRAKATRDGISISAQLAKIAEPGLLRDRLDLAWQSIKSGLVRGLSIGFAPIEYSILDGGGVHFLKWSWLELSAVTIPANTQASISAVKSFDAEALERASGPRRHTMIYLDSKNAHAAAALREAGKSESEIVEIIRRTRAAS